MFHCVDEHHLLLFIDLLEVWVSDFGCLNKTVNGICVKVKKRKLFENPVSVGVLVVCGKGCLALMAPAVHSIHGDE